MSPRQPLQNINVRCDQWPREKAIEDVIEQTLDEVGRSIHVAEYAIGDEVITRRFDPNPPMDGARIAEGGEEVTDAMVRARIRVDWRLAGGLSALLGVLIAACDGCGERDGGIGHGKKHSRTGPGASWRGS